MRRLPDAIKRRIVEHLACYRTRAEVVGLIAEEFDVHLTPRHVRAYDPTSFQFAGSTRWLEYYRLARKRFESELASEPIAHRAYRLRKLDVVRARAMAENDFAEAIKALEQAAKEVGNVFTNREKVQRDLPPGQISAGRTQEENRIILADHLREALERSTKA